MRLTLEEHGRVYQWEDTWKRIRVVDAYDETYVGTIDLSHLEQRNPDEPDSPFLDWIDVMKEIESDIRDHVRRMAGT